MSDALRLVLQHLEASGGRRVTVIRMRVGALSGVVPEALSFAFEALSPDTPAADARLELESVPVRWYCNQCQSDFAVEGYEAACPCCKGLDVEVRSGTEFELTSIEVD